MVGGMSFEDRTGKPPRAREALEAEQTVVRYMRDMEFMMREPGLAVMLPTIRRICAAYAQTAERLEQGDHRGAES